MKKVFVLLCLGLNFVLCSCNLGENKIISEIALENGDKKVIIFSRDVGATAGLSTHISIVKKSHRLSNGEKGNVCVFINKERDIFLNKDYFIEWETNKQLLIKLKSDLVVFKKKVS